MRRALTVRVRTVCGAALAAGAMALARGAAADPPPPPDHARIAALVHELAQDEAHKAVTAEAVARAGDALERAARMRDTGDEAHARMADAVAMEWVATGNDLRRAADAEAKAAELRAKAEEARAQAERTRALVEEAIARVGRLRAELAEAEHASTEDRTAVEVHDDDAKPPKKKKPKKAGAGGGAGAGAGRKDQGGHGGAVP